MGHGRPPFWRTRTGLGALSRRPAVAYVTAARRAHPLIRLGIRHEATPVKDVRIDARTAGIVALGESCCVGPAAAGGAAGDFARDQKERSTAMRRHWQHSQRHGPSGPRIRLLDYDRSRSCCAPDRESLGCHGRLAACVTASARLPPAIVHQVPMRRIGLVLVLSLLLAPFAAEAQARKAPGIGVLTVDSPEGSGPKRALCEGCVG